mgnify:CR=1 FL=1
MAIAKNVKNLKEVDLYGYCDDGDGNIEVTFHINTPGDYRLLIPEKNLKSMNRFSILGKQLKSMKLRSEE